MIAALLGAVPRAVWACPVCFGQSDAPMAKATNMGIFLMLGVTVAMLAAFGSFFIYLAKRARTQPVPLAQAGRVATQNEGTL